jgi:hypothetical protein
LTECREKSGTAKARLASGLADDVFHNFTNALMRCGFLPSLRGDRKR